jgi:hypothetical protein
MLSIAAEYLRGQTAQNAHIGADLCRLPGHVSTSMSLLNRLMICSSSGVSLDPELCRFATSEWKYSLLRNHKLHRRVGDVQEVAG